MPLPPCSSAAKIPSEEGGVVGAGVLAEDLDRRWGLEEAEDAGEAGEEPALPPQLAGDLVQPRLALGPVLGGVAHGAQLAHRPQELLDEPERVVVGERAGAVLTELGVLGEDGEPGERVAIVAMDVVRQAQAFVGVR